MSHDKLLAKLNINICGLNSEFQKTDFSSSIEYMFLTQSQEIFIISSRLFSIVCLSVFHDRVRQH